MTAVASYSNFHTSSISNMGRPAASVAEEAEQESPRESAWTGAGIPSVMFSSRRRIRSTTTMPSTCSTVDAIQDLGEDL